jgi:hypothetical protein
MCGSVSVRPAVRRAATAVLVAAAAGLSWVAGGTRPFSTAADAVTAAGFALVTAVALVALRWARPPTPRRGAWWPWAALGIVVVAFELAMYAAGFDGERARFPTLSALANAAGRPHAGRAGLFAAWLGLGIVLFWQPLGRHRPSQRRGGAGQVPAPDEPDGPRDHRRT